uniref:Integrase catalytic domain-containing protein n=1 Tax=Tanacetum cinerariifolium TaxID=118510 RepID=A0A699GP01_TANCI|nr:hypothetical protein [Tanacetum cinerariifolium]
MGLKGIAKVDRGWFLGCDLHLDCRGCEEEAIKARFSGNDATKKKQRTLLKQMYENFNAPSTESLDSIFNRLRKIVSQLAILSENISQEDLNMKFLRSLPTEWNTHVVVYRNKAYLDTMSVDDLYNNFKIVEQEVKRTVVSSSSSRSLNMAFLSSFGSPNEVNTASIQVSAVSTLVSTVSSPDYTPNLSDATVGNGFEMAVSFAEYERKKVLPESFDWSYMADDEVPTNMALMDFSNPEHPEFKGYGPKNSKSVCIDTSNEIKKALDAPIIKDWVTNSDEDESEVMVLKSDNVQHKPEQVNQLGKMVQKPVLKNVEKRTSQMVVKLVWNNAMRTNHQNFFNSRRNFAPTAVLTKSSIVPISTTRQISSRAATPVSAARPINTAASKPIGAPQDALKDQGYFDSGCSRHIIGNISYLTNFKEHDGVYVAFGGGAKGEKKVKIIRCDNGIEFKNRVMNEFCKEKCIKREYSVARTPQQNKVAERRNRTLIEAERTILADSKLPTTFWAEAVSTACYVQNRVLVVKPHFKNPYELFKDQLGKFDAKSNEGIFVGYSTTSKAFRVYNIRTRKVEENLHITFLENKPMIAGINSNDFTCKGTSFDAASNSNNKHKHGPSQASESDNHERPNAKSSTKTVNTARPVNTATPTHDDSPNDPLMPNLEDARIFDDAYDDRDEGAEADYNNLKTVISVSLIPSTRVHKDHPKEHITREIEPKNVTQALDNESWVEAMQEELLEFKLLNVWTLVDLPPGKRAIGTKWVYRNKRDQRGIVIRNKARLAIRLFLAYASFMDFTVCQMGVKSVFLYGTIEEEGYVSQPSGFVDPEFPDRVYKVEKALYGLHQAPRSWYETLSTYLLDNGFRKGTIDKTLFIKKIKDDIMLVQVYVNDIIFGSTKRYLSTEFEQLIHKRFQMSSMRELTFFLGLQTKIHLDNKSAIYVVKNLVYHSKTKHIKIRHHFIRDSYEKRLIEIVKIHYDYNVANLLTKAFDVTRF